MEDTGFVQSDPYSGTWDRWEGNSSTHSSTQGPYTVWDDIYMGNIRTTTPSQPFAVLRNCSAYAYFVSDSWIKVPHPRTHGLPKGRAPPGDSATSDESESELYVVAVLHQIHCIVSKYRFSAFIMSLVVDSVTREN